MKKKKLTNASIMLALFILVIAMSLAVFISWLKPKGATEQDTHLSSNGNDQQNISIDQQSQHPSESLSNAKAEPTDTEMTTAPSHPFQTGLENLPQSLQGTQVDGEIIIDENKQLVVTYGLRQLFDYFLSAVGEESAETIHTRVERYIRSRTPEPAASQAIAIYHSYVAYLQALTSIKDEFGSLQMQATQAGQFDAGLVKQRKQKVKQLRQQFFDEATIEAFFASEDSLENYALAMMAIEHDNSLTLEQKQAAKREHISRLPKTDDNQALQQYNQQQANIAILMQKTAELKQQNASAEQLYQMRVQLVGEAAAKRLAAVDKEEADFEQRFMQYQADKQAIIAQHGKDSTESAQKITELETSLFNKNEVRRLAGYEAVRNAKNETQNSE